MTTRRLPSGRRYSAIRAEIVRVDRPGPGLFLQGVDLAFEILELGVERGDRRGDRVEALIGGGARPRLQQPAEFVETRRHLTQPRGLLAERGLAGFLLPGARADRERTGKQQRGDPVF